MTKEQMKKTVGIHYHSPYLYQTAIDLAKSGMGIASVIASVTAVESLLGDIRLTYSTRHNLAEEMDIPISKLALIFNQPKPHTAKILPLTHQEMAALQIVEIKINNKGNVNRKPALNLFYQLLGCAHNEERKSSDFTKDNQREHLPSPIIDLFDLRHSVIHRDGDATIKSDDSAACQHGLPASIIRLIELGLISQDQIDENLGWLGLIDNSEVGKWAVNTARDFIEYILANLPHGAASDYLRANASP
ncbi:hypothetical protein LK540_02295 [Massilia sp. IC2-278]|uniref:hypothetical protein n=1 Tax=Massilia sp. IC2-278 TaxID=2887200 RepID=UPI001E5ACBEF|nr:hypothetical protein [Massilia sp. IC2-278]MCC2959256.1 hypothetical protein [Massilia sp. IC2-278]